MRNLLKYVEIIFTCIDFKFKSIVLNLTINDIQGSCNEYHEFTNGAKNRNVKAVNFKHSLCLLFQCCCIHEGNHKTRPGLVP